MLDGRQRLAFAAACATGAVIPLSLWVRYGGRQPRRDGGLPFSDSLPDAIVLGCYALPSGVPSDHLEDRLVAGLTCYRSGRVGRIIVSGAANAPTDEVAVMAQWLRQRDVPNEAIIEDPVGVRTMATMRNAATHLECRRALVCTHRYHLPRSLYLARAFGIEAVGVPADRTTLSKPVATLGREFAARAMAVIDLKLGTG